MGEEVQSKGGLGLIALGGAGGGVAFDLMRPSGNCDGWNQDRLGRIACLLSRMLLTLRGLCVLRSDQRDLGSTSSFLCWLMERAGQAPLSNSISDPCGSVSIRGPAKEPCKPAELFTKWGGNLSHR